MLCLRHEGMAAIHHNRFMLLVFVSVCRLSEIMEMNAIFLHVFNSFYLADSFAARNVVGFPTVSYFMSQARLEARSLQAQSSHPLQVRQPVTRESCLCFSILFHDELSTPLSRDVNCHFPATTAAVHRVSDFFSSKEIIFSASSCSSCVGSLEMSL